MGAKEENTRGILGRVQKTEEKEDSLFLSTYSNTY